jgi:hypothetical protein
MIFNFLFDGWKKRYIPYTVVWDKDNAHKVSSTGILQDFYHNYMFLIYWKTIQ